jgi:hypothetical protein
LKNKKTSLDCIFSSCKYHSLALRGSNSRFFAYSSKILLLFTGSPQNAIFLYHSKKHIKVRTQPSPLFPFPVSLFFFSSSFSPFFLPLSLLFSSPYLSLPSFSLFPPHLLSFISIRTLVAFGLKFAFIQSYIREEVQQSPRHAMFMVENYSVYSLYKFY